MSEYLIDPELLEMLCCPACRGDLTLHEERSELSCSGCDLVFPIIDGIPVLFPTDVRARYDELFKRHWDSEECAEMYDRCVEGGEAMMDLHNHRGEVRATMAVIGDLRGGRLVDCGCGNGRFFERYHASVYTVGVDASLNLLRICKKKGRCSRLVCAELEHLPFKDGVFDRAVCVRVLQHLRQQRGAVLEMGRVVADSGEVILHCYNELSTKGVMKRIRQSRLAPILNAPFRAVFRTMSPFAPWGLAYDKYNTVRQVKRWLADGGLKVTKVRGAGFGFNKWFLGGFMIHAWLEKNHPTALERYFAASLRCEEALGRFWPFNRLMEKFVLKGVKNGLRGKRIHKERPGESANPVHAQPA